MIHFQLENIDLIIDLVRSLTQLSTHCMVLSGSKALRSVSPSHPLRLAHTAVLPAACPVFKWATHKFWTCFIGYKRGRKRAEHKTRFCRQKTKITATPGQMPSVTLMSSTAMKPLLLVSASISIWSIEEQRKWLRRYHSLQHLYIWATFSVLEKVWWWLQSERTWSSCFHCCYCETWAGSQMIQNEGTPSTCLSRCWRTHKFQLVHLFSANCHFLVWITNVFEEDSHSLRWSQLKVYNEPYKCWLPRSFWSTFNS